MDSYYLVEVGTPKGEALISEAKLYFTEIDDSILKEKDSLMAKVEESFPLKMDLSNLWDDMARTFNADFGSMKPMHVLAVQDAPMYAQPVPALMSLRKKSMRIRDSG